MTVYGTLLDRVAPDEREDLDRMMNHLTVMGGFTPAGTLDVLPTLPYIVERLVILADRYNVRIPHLDAAELTEVRNQFVRQSQQGAH